MNIYTKRFLLVLGLSLFTVGLIFFIFECGGDKSCLKKSISEEENLESTDTIETNLEEVVEGGKTELVNDTIEENKTELINETEEEILLIEENKSYEDLEVFLMVSQGTYNPQIINVYVGQKLTMRAYAKDSNLGISIPEFSISQNLVLEKYTDIVITSNKTGKFKFTCNSACNSSYSSMKGFINVIE